jgi:uncharacterized protein YbaR (Trm112 family)
MPLRELAPYLVCPCCRHGALEAGSAGSLTCRECTRSYALDSGVPSFLVPERLSQTNTREIKANSCDLSDARAVDLAVTKEMWNSIHSHQMNWVMDIVDAMLDRYGGANLYSLGCGSGFELQLLLRRRRFARVFASDISPSMTSLVAKSLASYEGDLGLFASEFQHCPVPKHRGNVGLVFQALHHAPDAHAALESLLDHNFLDLVIVEPVTNVFLGALARVGLVQRVEYSGTRPDWLHLRRIEAIAKGRGYSIRSRTWWEIPPYLMPRWLERRAALWRPMYGTVKAASVVTGAFRFGSMAAVWLSREARG